MNRLSYTTAARGGWIAVASDAYLVVLHPDASDRVADLWEAVNGPGPFSAVIRILARDGFSALPEFAVIDGSASRLRVILRGAVSLEIDDAHGTHSQDGSDVSTWTERTFDGATAVRVSVHQAESAEVPTAYPLVRGAALMSSCALALALELGEGSPEPKHEGAAPEAIVLVEATLLAVAIAEQADAVAVSETTVSAVADADRDDESDALTGDTVFVPRRRPTPAAHEDEAAGPASEKQPDEQSEEQLGDEVAPVLAGDHDGMTILSSELPKGRTMSAAAAAPPATSPVVLVAADDERHPLDQPIIVGRAPSATQVSGGRLPRLVTIGGSDPDISRTHARFALEGDSVVVTDLHSRNGTLVVLPGKTPQKLRAGEPTTVIVGTVIDLGGGITFTVDG